MRLEALERTFLVPPHQARIAGHIGGEDRGKSAGRGHRSGSPLSREGPVVPLYRQPRAARQGGSEVASFLWHPGLAQTGEKSAFEQGADFRRSPGI